MFKSILSFGRQANRQVVDAVYEAIVASARQPLLYSRWEVPDTPLGRYEMVSLHMVLFLERAHGVAALDELAQEVTDEFFKDVDHSLRELGISDVGVPKRMKRLAKMYYGRTAAYADALERQDDGALVAALGRNIRPDEEWLESAQLATYVKAVVRNLSAQDLDAICAGSVKFPRAGEQGQ
jgi:cytochrome b pre-mRNA-processing protein 3